MPEQTGREPVSGSNISEKLAHDLGVEGYIYGYPLVLMDATRQVGTNVPNAGENAAPINQLGQKRSFPDDTFTTVVSPNADTLYSFAFLDLSKEPMVLSVPEMGNRYYLMEMLDAWTNVFASPGTRTTGSRRPTSPSSARNGLAHCRQELRRSSPRPISCGSSAAPRPTDNPTTQRFTRFRISTN